MLVKLPKQEALKVQIGQLLQVSARGPTSKRCVISLKWYNHFLTDVPKIGKELRKINLYFLINRCTTYTPNIHCILFGQGSTEYIRFIRVHMIYHVVHSSSICFLWPLNMYRDPQCVLWFLWEAKLWFSQAKSDVNAFDLMQKQNYVHLSISTVSFDKKNPLWGQRSQKCWSMGMLKVSSTGSDWLEIK